VRSTISEVVATDVVAIRMEAGVMTIDVEGTCDSWIGSAVNWEFGGFSVAQATKTNSKTSIPVDANFFITQSPKQIINMGEQIDC